QFQRPYRASEPPMRGPAKTAGSDPLAELARLIGQTDPFGEFARDTARRAPAPQPGDRSDWNTEPTGTPYPAQTRPDPRAPQRLGGNGYYGAPSVPGEQPDMPHRVQRYGRQADSG